MPSKTQCSISRDQFHAGAKPITVVIAGVTHQATAKEMSTGSLGWNINGKMQVQIGDKMVECQIGFNLTVVNSKLLPGATAAA